jgi:hypothetical protein
VGVIGGFINGFKTHIVFDRLYALDATSNFHGFVYIGSGADETAQLHDTFKRFDIDLA